LKRVLLNYNQNESDEQIKKRESVLSELETLVNNWVKTTTIVKKIKIDINDE